MQISHWNKCLICSILQSGITQNYLQFIIVWVYVYTQNLRQYSIVNVFILLHIIKDSKILPGGKVFKPEK